MRRRLVRELGNWSEFLRETGSLEHLWIVRGYQTAEDCSKWFAGGRVLFDEIAEWVAEGGLLLGDVVCVRDDYTAQFGIAFCRASDAVAFALRWGDFIDQGSSRAG